MNFCLDLLKRQESPPLFYDDLIFAQHMHPRSEHITIEPRDLVLPDGEKSSRTLEQQKLILSPPGQ